MKRAQIGRLLLVIVTALYALATVYQSPAFIADTSIEKLVLSSSKAIIALVFLSLSLRRGFKTMRLLAAFISLSVLAGALLLAWLITGSQSVAYVCCSAIGMSSGLGALLLATALSMHVPIVSKRLLLIGWITGALLLLVLHFIAGINETSIEIVAYAAFAALITASFVRLRQSEGDRLTLRVAKKDYPLITNVRKLLKSSHMLRTATALSGACVFAFCFGLFETVAVSQDYSIYGTPEAAIAVALAMVALYVVVVTLRRVITMDIFFVAVGFIFIAAIMWALHFGEFTIGLFITLSVGIYVYYQAVWIFMFDMAHTQKIAISLIGGATVFVIALSRVVGRIISEALFARVEPDAVIGIISPWALSVFTLALFLLVMLLVKAIQKNIKDDERTREPFSDAEESIKSCLKGFPEKYRLTSREAQVLQEYALGRSMPYISKRMYLSKNTVKTHISRAYVKLGVHNKQELKSLIEREMDETSGGCG